jgi:hypothetical protein
MNTKIYLNRIDGDINEKIYNINFLSDSNFKTKNNFDDYPIQFDDGTIRNLQDKLDNFPYHPYDRKFGQANNINCIQESNCISPNKCIYNNKICNCSITYANFFSDKQLQINENINSTLFYCNYERKVQLTAFFLTIFFNFGIAQFYIGSVSVGLVKLAIAIVSIIFIPFAVFYKNPLLSMLVGLFFCFIISIWGLVDLILFGINLYNDGNDVPLTPW